MSQPQTYDKVPQTNNQHELAPLDDESRANPSKRQLHSRKPTDLLSKEVAPEDNINWQEDTPKSPITPLPLKQKQKHISGKDQKVFDALIEYFSWTARTKDLTRMSKTSFAFPYAFIMITVFGGLFCTLLASLLLLINQNDFSNAYTASQMVLGSFVSSEEIRVSRADCQLVDSDSIRAFLTMNDKFAMVIAIVSFIILISLMLVVPLSKRLGGKKDRTSLIVNLIAGFLSALCMCKIILIATIFYVPMHKFTQLLNNFLTLEASDCFTTSLGEAVTVSLVAIQDEFDKLKVWMWVDLGAVAGILLFPCMECLASLFKGKKKATKPL